MEEWFWFSPTKIFFGPGVVEKNQPALLQGKKAFIVTGAGGSSRTNGVLDHVCQALSNQDVSWSLFDQILPNPDVQNTRQAALLAWREQVDFVVGVGGGSPLDAAKAIAALAVNDLSDEELFAGQFDHALPIIAIPTTAGTGSEVTPYSILTYPAINSKKSIASPCLIPRAAFLDPNYTYTLPRDITIDTAVDAFSHVFESLLTVRTSPLSQALCREALGILGRHLRKMAAQDWNPDEESRSQLLYASMVAGQVISHTGTSIPHALGYSFTYFKGIPHGRANGLILPAYAAFMAQSNPTQVVQALSWSGFTSLEDYSSTFLTLAGTPPQLEPDEFMLFVELCSQAKNLANSLVQPTKQDIQDILTAVLN